VDEDLPVGEINVLHLIAEDLPVGVTNALHVIAADATMNTVSK